MAYSDSLGVLLADQGSLTGTWGTALNNQVFALLDSAIAGRVVIGGSDEWDAGDSITYTLSSTQGAVNQARAAIIHLQTNNAKPAAAVNIVVPNVSKAYIINNSLNLATNIAKISAVGGGATENSVFIPKGAIAEVYCDGAGKVTSAQNFIVGGVIEDTTIGLTTPSTGAFTTLVATSIGVASQGTGKFTALEATSIGVASQGTGKFTTLEATTNSLIGETLQINTTQLGATGLISPNLTIQSDAVIDGGYVAANQIVKPNIQLGVAIPFISFGNVINSGSISSKSGLIGLNTHLISSGGAGSLTTYAVLNEMVIQGANVGFYSLNSGLNTPSKRVFLNSTGAIGIYAGPQAGDGTITAATASSTVYSTTGTITTSNDIVSQQLNISGAITTSNANMSVLYAANGAITTTTPLNTITTNQTTGDWKVTQTHANADANASIELVYAAAGTTAINLQSGLNGFTVCDGRFLIKRRRTAGLPATTGGLVNLANYAGVSAWQMSVLNGTADEPSLNIVNATSPGQAGVTLTWGATSWSSFSDERLKNVTGVVEDATTMLSNLRTVYYTLKSDTSNVEKVGLIAQDVQTVLPCAVNETNEDDDTLSLRYTDMIPVLVKAVQELSSRLAVLENGN